LEGSADSPRSFSASQVLSNHLISIYYFYQQKFGFEPKFDMNWRS